MPPSGSNPSMAHEMADLVTAAKAGDRAAFEELVRATSSDAYTLAFRLTGNEEDARDVMQDAYVRAWKGLRRFRGDAAFSTWLYRIVANCASNSLRKRVRHRHETLDEAERLADDRPEVDPEQRAAGEAERARVSAALLELPPKLRAVVVLRDVYDLPHEAIAEELGITEAAAKVRLHRARRKLRERLYPIRGEALAAVDEEQADAV